ncbi:hypothetical protein GEMRC1_007269 [Eukaryota sp. GEM-RC1]
MPERSSLPPITSEPGLSSEVIDLIVNSDPFESWYLSLDSGFLIERIHFQSVDQFGSRIGFVKFKVDAIVDGNHVPGIVFL